MLSVVDLKITVIGLGYIDLPLVVEFEKIASIGVSELS